MSRRFNPVSAGVAAVTATVILGIAGCAMGTRTDTADQTDSAGLSREANASSQAPVQGDTSSTMPGTTAMDTPASPSTTVALPAEPAPMANDTAARPPTDTSQPTASTSTSSSAGTMPTTSGSDMSSGSSYSSDNSLPPRADRN